MKEYFPAGEHRLPVNLRLASTAAKGGVITSGFISAATHWSIERMARKFIAGDNIEHALNAIKSIEAEGMTFTFDILGEATTSEEQAERYVNSYINLIEGLSTHNEFSTIENRINVSVKISSLYSQFDPLNSTGTSLIVRSRLKKILDCAARFSADVTIDMEQYSYRDLTLQIIEDMFENGEIPDSSIIGIVLQAYLKDSRSQLQRTLSWLKQKRKKLNIRLVKGAYWDYETIISKANRWESPVFENKDQTDANFEILSAMLFENSDCVNAAFASHNIRSIATAIALAEEMGVNKDAFEFQLLYGMGDPIKKALVDGGYRVRVYAPFGEIIPGMGYLVRRILENTSNNSFLMKSFFHEEPVASLLESPHEIITPNIVYSKKEEATGFQIEPLADFSILQNREEILKAIEHVKSKTGRHYPLIIGGKKKETSEWIPSLNPSDPDMVVGYSAKASREDADAAVEEASKAFERWGKVPHEKRCEYLFKAAKIMRRNRFELAALEVIECGKPAREADADVCEAVDYLNYYAYEMMRLSSPRILDPIPGETNTYSYIPRGVAVVISPWNFPLAILTGMASAAISAGNTVIMKPAEQSPVIAYRLMEIFEEAGIPDGVVNLISGKGEEAGAYLVSHPGIDLIAFTGSMEVGLKINETAAQTGKFQKNIKKVIAEMGGKNALIIDSDADMDEAVKATVASAFGYAGQKCSACSRVIVLKDIYDHFVMRLKESTAGIKIGTAEEPSTFIGPLIDVNALNKVRKYIELGKKEAETIYETPSIFLPEKGYFAGPAIFACSDNTCAVAKDEIFGPVLSVFRADNIAEAIKLANGNRYALTGGILSRSPANIQKVKQELNAGNIYINRKITGAIVGRQPFGGYKMSGIGSKAGGPDYLLQFMIPVSVTENIMRHGYAPIEEE